MNDNLVIVIESRPGGGFRASDSRSSVVVSGETEKLTLIEYYMTALRYSVLDHVPGTPLPAEPNPINGELDDLILHAMYNGSARLVILLLARKYQLPPMEDFEIEAAVAHLLRIVRLPLQRAAEEDHD